MVIGHRTPLCEYEGEGLERLNMATTTITVDAETKARLADLARLAGQEVDQFAEALLRRVADANLRFEHSVPVFPRRPGAPVLKDEDVARLMDAHE